VNEILYEVDAGVAILVLNAPNRRNALTPELAASLITQLDRAADDRSVGALVLRAEGPSFCAGADLATVRAAMPDPLAESSFSGLGTIYELFRRLVQFPIPTLAAVQGPAVGAGINLALACDVRIVSEDAEFIGFARAGVHPGGGHLELLRSIDRQTAAWLALFSQPISAVEAVRTGIAARMTGPDELVADAMALGRAAAADPELSRMVTATYRAIDGMDARHNLSVHAERAAQVWSLRRLYRDPL
jgi:enoyl-CoA hydratase